MHLIFFEDVSSLQLRTTRENDTELFAVIRGRTVESLTIGDGCNLPTEFDDPLPLHGLLNAFEAQVM